MGEPGQTPGAATAFLPYRCERLRGDYLQSPCGRQVAEAEARRQKFPQALLGPLEHCLACRGRDLIIREAAAGKIEPSVEPSVDLPAAAKKAKEGQNMGGVVACKDEAEAARVLGPGKIPVIAECLPPLPVKGQFCKYHPEVESRRNKHGTYMGLCRECLAARASRNSRNRGQKALHAKMTHAVARDLGKRPPARLPDTPPDPLRCATHNLPIKFNRLGVSMGGCEVCRQEIASPGGHRAMDKVNQGPLERIFAEHPEELAWLRQHSQGLVRKPEEQLIFICRVLKADGVYRL